MFRPRALIATAVLAAACAGKTAPSPTAPAPVSAPPSTKAAATPARPAPPEINPLLAQILQHERAVLQAPQSSQAWGVLAADLAQSNRLQEAARAAWRAVELSPTADSWQLLGKILEQGAAPTAAWAAFDEVAQQSSDDFVAAQNYMNLGVRAWRWGMDDFARRAYDRADQIAPGHPMVAFNRILLLASTGKTEEAQTEANKLHEVIDRLLADRPPPEMVELLEPMKALSESVAQGEHIARQPPVPEPLQPLPDRFWRRDPNQGHALDLAIDARGARYYPVKGWRVLQITVPTEWVDQMTVRRERNQFHSASIRFDARSDEPEAVCWLLMVSERGPSGASLDQLAAEAQKALPGQPKLSDIRSFTSAHSQGRLFVADDPSARPNHPEDFPRLVQAVLDVDGFLVVATRLLRDTSPAALAETEDILKTVDMVDWSPRPQP